MSNYYATVNAEDEKIALEGAYDQSPLDAVRRQLALIKRESYYNDQGFIRYPVPPMTAGGYWPKHQPDDLYYLEDDIFDPS